MKGKLLRKLCVVSLSVLMIAGAGTVNVVPFISEGLSVSAAEVTSDGNFIFEYLNNNIEITNYIGSHTDIVIPDTINGIKVTKISDKAFYSCKSLTSVTIPGSIVSIGNSTFAECSNLKTVKLENGITGIGKESFYNCQSLTSVTIPDSVVSIGEKAFYNCTNLTSVTIPESVMYIGDRAFYGCSDLSSLSISDRISNIGKKAFYGCNRLADKDGFVIVRNVLYNYCGYYTNVTIPDNVTSIGDMAFYNCQNVTSVTIPDSVTSIGFEAFYNCRGLTSITIPDSVTSIDGWAFKLCVNLSSFSMSKNVTKIEDSMFSECHSLTSVTIPDGITSIGRGAFTCCNNLRTVIIPDSVKSIGEHAFSHCPELGKVDIPVSVTSIGNYGFAYCNVLYAVTIHASTTSIGSEAFERCSSLILYGTAHSYIENYANAKKIPFTAITFPLSNISSLSTNSIILGNSVTVNCTAQEGTDPYTYAVCYRKAGTTKWTMVQGYKDNATVTFKPKAAVNYEIRVAVKDANGKIERKDMTLVVKKPLANTSKLNLDTIKLGEKVKVRCFAQNGETPYTFSVQYKKSTAEKWVNLAVNSTNNIFVLKPTSATTYDIRVTAKSPDGQVAKKTLTLTVTK